MADPVQLIRRKPSDAMFEQACAIVTEYVNDPESGWDRERRDRVRKILNNWQLELFANEQHAAHDSEKS